MQTPIDFKTVESVPYRKTITLVNNFIINTTEFLNKFSYLCEKKLENVSQQIQKLEITMNILEAKLASIPGLEGSVPIDNNVPPSPEMNNVSSSAPIPPPPPGPGSYSSSSTTTTATISTIPVAPSEPEPNSDVLKVKDDPRYQPYFKMLRLGVVPENIKLQMRSRGVNPDLLDTPDAPAPSSDAPTMGSASVADEDEDEDEDEEEEKAPANGIQENSSFSASSSLLPPPPIPSATTQLPPPPVTSTANDEEDDDEEDEDDD